MSACGPFYTTGFQEDHKARTNGVFNDEEYLKQATLVLEERPADVLIDFALEPEQLGPERLINLEEQPLAPVETSLVGT